MGFWGARHRATPLIDSADYDTEGEETDGDKREDEGRSVSWVEWAIPPVAGRCRAWVRRGRGWRVAGVCLVVGHGG